MRPRAAVGTWLDACERGLSRLHRFAGTPGGGRVLLALILVLALGVRAPEAFAGDEIPSGLSDSRVYFWYGKLYWSGKDYLSGKHRADGQSWVNAGALALWGAWPPHLGEYDREADAWNEHVIYLAGALVGAATVIAAFYLALQLMPRPHALAVALLVALDPLLVRESARAMSEPMFVLATTSAIALMLAARARPWMLAPAGLALGVAYAMRINGLVVALVLATWAAWVLRRHLTRPAPRLKAAGLLLAGFLVIATPYAAWRTVENGSPFEYGTNTRLWTDDLWDLDDAYWTKEFQTRDGRKETFLEYWETHTFAQIAHRLGWGLALPILDVTGAAALLVNGPGFAFPPQDEGAFALTPLALVGIALAARALYARREWAFLTSLAIVTWLTLAWMYPLTRSVRYFSFFIPLALTWAVLGWAAASRRFARPRLVMAVALAAGTLPYQCRLLSNLEGAADTLAHMPRLAWVLVHGGAVLLLAALTAGGARAPHETPDPPAPQARPPLAAR